MDYKAMAEMSKPNCYECKHRGEVAGSAHSKCAHPAFRAALDDPMAQLFGILASVGRVPPMQAKSTAVKVVGKPHGIKNGWFNHPFDFDPIWLESCDGFTPKDVL